MLNNKVLLYFIRYHCHCEKHLPEMFYKKGVLKNLTKFTGKHLCQSLFFNKVCNFIKNIRPATLLKKETLAQAFSCVFYKIFKNTFLTKHLRVTASALFTAIRILGLNINYLNPLSVNPTKWSNILRQFGANLPTNHLSRFDHFAGLALKRLILKCLVSTKNFINN